MADQTKNGMQCHEFDLLLSDALDGVLTGAKLDRFQAHSRACLTCGPLLAEAEAGRTWLKGLKEVEPPASLVTNILASTTGVDTQRLWANAPQTQPPISWWERIQAWTTGAMQPVWAGVRQPRFAMSFGMAFFSLSVGLTVAGVKPTDVRGISLRPAAIRHTYYSTQARVVRYYDNIRFVYEVESLVRPLMRSNAPAEPGPRESKPVKPKEHKNDTSQEPEQKEERNYSQSGNQFLLAGVQQGPSVVDLLHQDSPRQNSLRQDASNKDLPVVLVTTCRRFV